MAILNIWQKILVMYLSSRVSQEDTKSYHKVSLKKPILSLSRVSLRFSLGMHYRFCFLFISQFLSTNRIKILSSPKEL